MLSATAAQKEDKFAELRKVIINIFDENKRRYGYRRIHIELKKIGWKISEKIVRRIMKEEHLEVRITKENDTVHTWEKLALLSRIR